MVGDIFQPTHLLFVLVIALLVLGPKRLPEVGRTLGSSIRDFREAINGATGGLTGTHQGIETEPWRSTPDEPAHQAATAPAPATTTPTAPVADSPMPSAHTNGTEHERATSTAPEPELTASVAPQPEPAASTEPTPIEHEFVDATEVSTAAEPLEHEVATGAPASPAGADAPAPQSQG
jgi:sec-independent protein translocase protein TatA